MVFLFIDVTKNRNFMMGCDLRSQEDDEVRPCLRKEGDDLYLGIYMKGQFTIDEYYSYSQKIQKWLRRHNLGGIAFGRDSSYRLLFIEEERESEITDWICEQ